MTQFEDKNQDGIPDVIEDTLEELKKTSLGQKVFTKRNFYLFLFMFVIILGYTILGWLYIHEKEEKIAIQNQFHWAKSENEIEVDREAIKDRKEALYELDTNYDDLLENLETKRKFLDKHIDEVENNKEKFKDEADSLNINQLRGAFDKLGYPTK